MCSFCCVKHQVTPLKQLRFDQGQDLLIWLQRLAQGVDALAGCAAGTRLAPSKRRAQ
jgi:hypothetical protein